MNDQNAKSKKKGFGKVQWIVIVLCLCVFLFSGWQVLGINKKYQQNEDTYNEIAEFVLQTSYSETESEIEDDDVWPLEEFVRNQSVLIPAVDFDALLSINRNAVAWLYSPGTVINYPVARGSDNDYYLNHSFNNRYDEFGALFMDYRNEKDFSDRNTLIYGHHLKNGNMFHSLEFYRDQAYYDEHPVIYMTTATGKYRLEIFAGYVTAATSDSYRLYFQNDGVFSKWVDTAKSKSTFASDVQPAPTDRVVTLSTCVYDFNNARYVLHCRLVECEGGIWY